MPPGKVFAAKALDMESRGTGRMITRRQKKLITLVEAKIADTQEDEAKKSQKRLFPNPPC
jgi:hypothetical protein